MKITGILINLILCASLGLAVASIASCSAGAHIGPVGADAGVG